MTIHEHEYIRKSGMMWEIWPEFTGNYADDKKIVTTIIINGGDWRTERWQKELEEKQCVQ